MHPRRIHSALRPKYIDTSEEISRENGRRTSQHVLRAAQGFQAALINQRDLPAECSHFRQVVGDVNNRQLLYPMQVLNLCSQPPGIPPVESTERFVQQEQTRFGNQRPSYRNPLLLASAQRGRITVEKMFNAEGVLPSAGYEIRFPRRGLLIAKTESHIPGDVEMGNSR